MDFFVSLVSSVSWVSFVAKEVIGMNAVPQALTIVVLTHDRREEVLDTLARLLAVSEGAPIRVVDNASTDGTAEAVAAAYPQVELIRLPQNLGAAGRNCGVAGARSRYVACCDDDTWWAPGALAAAVRLLDAHPRLAVVTARVLVGHDEHEDPASREMAESPLPNALGLPGTEVAGLLAGACVLRREAYLAVGGYEPRFFIGGEERLLALDLLAAGWHLGYAPALVVHHHPSPLRDMSVRRRLLLRNALWGAWLRRPISGAWRETARHVRQIRADPRLLGAGLAALLGLPWVLAARRVVPAEVESMLRLVESCDGRGA